MRIGFSIFFIISFSAKLYIPISIILYALLNWGGVNHSRYNGKTTTSTRQRININEGWRFMRYTDDPDKLIYDDRPTVTNRNDNIVADTRASDSSKARSSENVLKNGYCQQLMSL